MSRMEFHEYADIFPLIAETELQSLSDDIKANGLLHPVITFNGKILDGRNRYLACMKAGVDPRFEEFSGNDALSFIISENLNRRHLNESQRAIVAARLANIEHGGNRKNQTANLRLDKVSTETAASMLNVGKRSVELAKEVLRIQEGKKVMTSNQYKIVMTAERWRNAGFIGDVPLAATWRRPGGGWETLCPYCAGIHTHADVSGNVLSEQRSAHCVLMTPAINKGYYLKFLPGLMPDEVRKAAAVWPKIHRTSGEKYICDTLIDEARKKYGEANHE